MSRYQPPELLAARHQLACFRCRSEEQSTWLVEMAKQAHGTGTTRMIVVTKSEQPAPSTSKVVRPVRPKAHLGRCLAGGVPASAAAQPVLRCRQARGQGLPRGVRRRTPAPTTAARHRVWVTTAEACAALGMSREALRQLRLRVVLTPGKHYRRWGCTQGRGGHCSGIWRTWRPPSPAGAGGICSTERPKPGVESRLYRWP